MVHFISGHPMVLDCKVFEHNQEKVFWKRPEWDQDPRVYTEVLLDKEDGDESYKILRLTIDQPDDRDSGMYFCMVEDNKDEAVVMADSTSRRPYRIHTASGDEIFSASEKSLTLKCPVEGTPHPEVFWQRGDDVLEPSTKYTFQDDGDVKSAHLEISEPKNADFGEYMCTAENSLGKVDVTFNVVNATLAQIPGAKSGANSGQGDPDAAQAIYQSQTQLLLFHILVTIPMALLHLL
ncbi:lachesin [Elysia marginata]|uniref:Lachesin n=1 Tax=Elysia marginata TaxID=1093978 RepID=A0AAV4EGK6_9GAST|nr:lachesin [Elysia marginata]